MSKPRFTPGPWAVIGQSEVWRYIVVKAKNRRTTARVPFSKEGATLDEITDRADATLIAAAPDLYAALELARERMVGASPGMNALIAQTDTALSKARGES